VLLAGTGGDGFTRASIDRAREQTPDWDWTVMSRTLGTWHGDPTAVLATADVAVLHPGQNSLAEIASLRLPAIVVPAPRPFDEQRVTASALADGWPAVVVDNVPTTGWRDLLHEALFLDGEGWADWCDGAAPTRIASVVTGVVHGERAA
jgi:UDP-N-acetylglucosamine:LPS N-acetylglucosamine transferase